MNVRRTRGGLLAAAALTVAMVTVPPPTPAGAVDPLRAGFNTELAYPDHVNPTTFDEAELAAAVDDMTPNGVVRFVVPWTRIQPGRDLANNPCTVWAQTSLSCPNPGPQDWSYVDDQLQEVQAAGLGVLLVPMAAPAWNRDPFDVPAYFEGEQTFTPPGDTHQRLTQWQTFVVQLVSRIEARDPNLLVGVEIWNEPNGVLNWNTSLGGPPGHRYKRVLCYAYGAVKFVDPGLPVVFAGTNPNSASSFVTFVDDAYDAGAAACMDRLGIHPYPTSNPAAPLADHIASYETTLTQLRAVRDAHGDSTRKIAITEVSTQGPEATTAAFLAETYASAKASTDIDMYLASAVFDTATFPNEGLCAAPGVPKPRASAFREAVTGISGTASC